MRKHPYVSSGSHDEVVDFRLPGADEISTSTDALGDVVKDSKGVEKASRKTEVKVVKQVIRENIRKARRRQGASRRG